MIAVAMMSGALAQAQSPTKVGFVYFGLVGAAGWTSVPKDVVALIDTKKEIAEGHFRVLSGPIKLREAAGQVLRLGAWKDDLVR
ncbi:MAG: hypothetical protein JSR83_06445 [Proteobacteria bacterium]|uniref:hypothetical protein n=1 Tax=Zoogloea sp. LCSB751 TaxID=1965277 RepID=UPI0009A49924|nr:hypothetical protein [Zoogloea sp. LCSB751]MBS0353525.1 hypothetical protein [Pseudomonadota bacterium]